MRLFVLPTYVVGFVVDIFAYASTLLNILFFTLFFPTRRAQKCGERAMDLFCEMHLVLDSRVRTTRVCISAVPDLP